jgi:CO dehydrogenase/acetyl-CoA synthase alpha subunit
MSATKDMSKLTLAAEELIKAASTHVESTSLAIGKETVEGLKQLSVNSTSIEKSVEALKLLQESKMNTLIQSIAELKKEMTELNANVVLQTKHQTLEWAISNAEMGSFKYYEKADNYNCYHCNRSQVASAELVRLVLMIFRNGSGRYIDKLGLTHTSSGGVNDQNKESEKNFRDALSTQIHNLTGQKPRFAITDGRYAIYYS